MVVPAFLTALLLASAHSGSVEQQHPKAGPAGAGQLSSPAARSARTSAREQALAELDDPDPLTRAGAFEDIVKSRDAVLIQFAQRKVLTSTDDNLKAMLIRSRLLEPKRIFTIDLLACGDKERHKTDYCSQALGAITKVPIAFLPAEGADRFLVYSTAHPGPNDNVAVRSGTISGTTTTFQVNLQSTTFYLHECTAALKLSNTGMMEGRMECGNLMFNVQFRLI